MDNPIYFKSGLVLGTILSVKLCVLGLALFFVLGHFVPVLELALDLFAMIWLVMTVVGHFKTTYVLLMGKADTSKEKDDVLNGVIYRLKKDVHYAKKVLIFDFKT